MTTSYDWYNIFSYTDFVDSGLVAQTLLLELEDLGRKSFYITKGNTVAVSYDDAFLPVNLLEQNPYAQNGYAVYLDADDEVWFGFEVDQ